MNAMQVFSNYDHRDNLGIKGANYCIVCGAKLILKQDGGRERPTCPQCGYTYYKNPSTAVSILIRNEKNQILLGKRKKNSTFEKKWCLPCGFIEFDEDFLTAAIRETKEETGLSIEVKSIISVVTNYLVPGLHSLVIVMLADVAYGIAKAGDDIEDLMWLSEKDTFPEMAFEADTHIIERYYQDKLKGVPVDYRYSCPNNSTSVGQ